MESCPHNALFHVAFDRVATPQRWQKWLAGCWVLVLVASGAALAQSPVQSCNVTGTKPSFCSAVPGDRSEGWLRQGRSETMAQHGMVTTSQSLAAQAGLRILMKGGNAVDAAVATAAALNLMEPMNVGIAGDLFAIIYIAKDKKLYAINASGKAPTGATLQHYNDLGYQWDGKDWGYGANMPGGILSVTVPGAAWGWDEVMRRFGRLSLKEVMEPAIEYAENGFPVTERIANDWNLPRALGPDPSSYAKGCCTQVDPDSVATWYVNGVKPAPGQIYRNPDLAKTFRLFARHGRKAFYTGEAKKLAYNDLYRYTADPDSPSNAGLLQFIQTLATKSHASSLCGLVDPAKAGCPTGNGYGACSAPAAPANGGGDTIVLSTADRWGNMVSWVNSNFAGFGSGITVPGYGFVLHNRGQQFTMNPNHPDKIEPHKRPYNTLSAG